MPLGKKQVLKLGLISLAAITVGAIVGLVLNYQTIKELRSPKVGPTPPPVIEEEKEKIATYSGTIKPAGKLYPPATHYLENESEEMILLLESSKIDLGFIEGQTVEVEGKLKKTVEGERQILEVEKVRF